MTDLLHYNQDASNAQQIYVRVSSSAAVAPPTCPPARHRRRRARTMFDEAGLARLEAVFAVDQYPDIGLREQLAEQIAVPEARIQTWFQNKRSRTRRSRHGHDLSPPGASTHSVSSDKVPRPVLTSSPTPKGEPRSSTRQGHESSSGSDTEDDPAKDFVKSSGADPGTTLSPQTASCPMMPVPTYPWSHGLLTTPSMSSAWVGLPGGSPSSYPHLPTNPVAYAPMMNLQDGYRFLQPLPGMLGALPHASASAYGLSVLPKMWPFSAGLLAPSISGMKEYACRPPVAPSDASRTHDFHSLPRDVEADSNDVAHKRAALVTSDLDAPLNLSTAGSISRTTSPSSGYSSTESGSPINVTD